MQLQFEPVKIKQVLIETLSIILLLIAMMKVLAVELSIFF